MFNSPLPLAGESAFEGVPKLLVNGMLTAGVALTQHFIEVYLTRHLGTASHPALKEVAGSIHYHRGHFITSFKPHNPGLDAKPFLRIALPASTTVKHACSASYVSQPPSAKASVVGIALCTAVAIITVSTVFLNSHHRGVSENGSSASSTSPSSSDASSNRGSSSRLRRAMLVTGSGGSGGNDPARGRDSTRSSLFRGHPPSPLRRMLATAESGTPPPPPPPHFPPPAEDDDKNHKGPLGFFVDWISIFLLVPIVVQLGRLFFSRPARRSGSQKGRSVMSVDVGQGDLVERVADTLSSYNLEDPTRDDILPSLAPESRVLLTAKSKPMIDNGTTSCQNDLPLATSRVELKRSQYQPSHLLGLTAGGSSTSVPKNIEATKAGRSLRFLSTLAFMVGGFFLSLLPLVLFYLAGRQPDVDDEPEQRTSTVDGDSSEEGEGYDMFLESPDVRPIEDQVLARIALHFRPLRDSDMDSDSEPESESDDFVHHTPTHPKIQMPVASTSRSSASTTEPPPAPNALNPNANTFVPKKSFITHDERLVRWRARQFPQPQLQPLLPQARTAGPSSQILQSTHTANNVEHLAQSSMNPWPQPVPAQTPGSSSQVHRFSDSSSIEGIQTESTLTPNQKSNLRRRMRRSMRKEEERETQDLLIEALAPSNA